MHRFKVSEAGDMINYPAGIGTNEPHAGLAALNNNMCWSPCASPELERLILKPPNAPFQQAQEARPPSGLLLKETQACEHDE